MYYINWIQTSDNSPKDRKFDTEAAAIAEANQLIANGKTNLVTISAPVTKVELPTVKVTNIVR